MPRQRRGRHEGSVYKRKSDGLWVASRSFGIGSDGKRVRRTATAKTKSAAVKKLAKLSPRSASTNTKLGVWLDEWHESRAGKRAETTRERDERLIRLQIKPYLDAVKLTDITGDLLECWFEDAADDGVSASSIGRAATLLHTALGAATRKKLIPHNPLLDVEKPKGEAEEMSVLTFKQTQQFLKAAKSDPLYAMYVLALGSGMRQGELFGLRWDDINFDSGAVIVQRSLRETRKAHSLATTKTPRGRRKIDLPSAVLETLHDHGMGAVLEDRTKSPVFCDTRGGWLRKSNVTRRSFKPLLASARLPEIRFHDLRHTHATHLLLKGIHPKVVSERLGHSTVAITLDRYSHVLPTMQREATESLEGIFV